MNLEDLKKELETYGNIRKTNNNIEVKVHILNKKNEDYWNIMINDMAEDISVRWHVKVSELPFEEMTEKYFDKLTKWFEKNTDIHHILHQMSLLQERLQYA